MATESSSQENANMDYANTLDTKMFDGELFPDDNQVSKSDINFECFKSEEASETVKKTT